MNAVTCVLSVLFVAAGCGRETGASMVQTVLVLSVIYILGECRSLVILLLRWCTCPLPPRPESSLPLDTFPTVTVQVPVYREHLVLDRVLASTLSIRYPADRLRIQVLDDSEQDQAMIAKAIVGKYQGGPVQVDYLHRPERHGYKAGNLNYGLRFVQSDLVAILDADAEPRPEFLHALVPYFSDPKVGAVQARWDYFNDDLSGLTTMQAAVLDTLFCFENEVRARLGCAGFFLGSGGVWRKTTLDELGGWQEVPFTAEDFDLSYRARLAGWMVAYDPRLLSRCELPSTYLAYTNQQRRWARSCFRVLLTHTRSMFKSGFLGLLEGSLLFRQIGMQALLATVLVTTCGIVLRTPRTPLWMASQIALACVVILSPTLLLLILSQVQRHDRPVRRIRRLLGAVPLMVGLSVPLLTGFLETLFHPRQDWLKTLRAGERGVVHGSARRWLTSTASLVLINALLGACCAAAFAFAVARGYWECWPLLGTFGSGFLISAWVGGREIASLRKRHG